MKFQKTGKIPGVSYKLGPGFSKDHQRWKVRMVVNNFLEDKEDSNILGVIRGEVEPDQYVLLSNHRDACLMGSRGIRTDGLYGMGL